MKTVTKKRKQVSRLAGSSIPEKPVQRNAANARERARMRVLSRAFCRLKTSLPWVPPDTKLSKLDTLRLASTYIAHLRQMLQFDDDGDSANCCKPTRPVVLSWPFAFTNRPSSNENALSVGAENRSCTPPDHPNYYDFAPCEFMARRDVTAQDMAYHDSRTEMSHCLR